MFNRKQGLVRSWNEQKGWGVLCVGPTSSLDRYFFHVSAIRSGTATPVVGMEAYFDTDDAALVREGQLPKATRVDIIVPDESEKAGA
jgi:cold shock CspA family protein